MSPARVLPRPPRKPVRLLAPAPRPDRVPRRAPRRGHRLTPADDELYQRTHISLLQRDAPHAAYVESYSSRGFVVNGNRVFGPCALLPHSVLQWNVSAPRPPCSPGSRGPGERLPAKLRGFADTCPLPAQVGSHLDITEESFSLFWMLEPPLGKEGSAGVSQPPSPRAARQQA